MSKKAKETKGLPRAKKPKPAQPPPARQKLSIRRVFRKPPAPKQEDKVKALPKSTVAKVPDGKIFHYSSYDGNTHADVNLNPVQNPPNDAFNQAEDDDNSSENSSPPSRESNETGGSQVRRRLTNNTFDPLDLELQEGEQSASTEEIIKAIKKRRLDKQLNQEPEYDQEEPTGKVQRGALAMIFILAILFIAHCAAAVYLFMTPEPYENPNTCLTHNCKRMAKWLDEAMDKSRDPCDDFYMYTCGKFLAENPPLEPKGNETSHFTEGIPYKYDGNEKLGVFLKPLDEFPLDQILPFYKSCMFQKRRDQLGYKPLINVLSKLKLKILHQSGSRRPSVTRLMVRIYKMIGQMFFVNVNEVINNYITIKISKPPEELRAADHGTYAKTMRKVYKLFWDDFQIQDELHLDTIIYQVMSFEAELDMIQSKGQTIPVFGFPSNMHKYMTVPIEEHPAFTTSTGSFDWDDFVDELFVRDSQDYKRGENEERPVILFNYLYSLILPENRYYLLVLEQFMRRTPMVVIMYYFQWNIIKTFAFDLTSELQDIMQPIFATLGKTDVQRCFRSVFYNLNALAAERYRRDIEDLNKTILQVETVSKAIEEGIKKLSEKLPHDIKASVDDSMETIKITNGLFNVRSEHIATFYAGLVNTEDAYFANVVQARNMRARNEIYRLRKVYPYQDWPLGAYSLNVMQRVDIQDMYATYRHFLTPFGSLDVPFVGNALPAMDFGGIGFWMLSYYTITQIITDIFKKLASERNLQESLEFVKNQKNMETKLLHRFECIYEASSRLEVPQLPGVKLNPYGTNVKDKYLGDVIAVEALTKIFEFSKDNKYLFPKYQLLPGFEHYSPEKLFFHSLARHSCFVTTKDVLRYQLQNGPAPFHLRILGAFRLNRLFSKTWSCKKKSFMNAENKCQFFVASKDIITAASLKRETYERDPPIQTSSGESYDDSDLFR